MVTTGVRIGGRATPGTVTFGVVRPGVSTPGAFTTGVFTTGVFTGARPTFGVAPGLRLRGRGGCRGRRGSARRRGRRRSRHATAYGRAVADARAHAVPPAAGATVGRAVRTVTRCPDAPPGTGGVLPCGWVMTGAARCLTGCVAIPGSVGRPERRRRRSARCDPRGGGSLRRRPTRRRRRATP